ILGDSSLLDRTGVVAPGAVEMTEEDLFASLDQRFGQMRALLEVEEPIEFCELRVRRIEDDPGWNVVQHGEAIDHAPVIFGETRRDPSAAIVADECNTLV